MATNASEKKPKQRRKLFNLKFDKKILAFTLFFVFSITVLAFSTKYLFESNISDWHITQGSFVNDESSLSAQSYEHNWAFHESLVAYGEWEWEINFAGTGSASIIFIGLEPNESYFFLPTKGYKLDFVFGKSLSLIKLNGLGQEETLDFTSVFLKKQTFDIKISRGVDNVFNVILNNESKLQVLDNTYSTSEILQLVWFYQQQLDWIKVKDYIGENDWQDYFTGLPRANSDHISSKAALYFPFICLGLVFIYFIFRMLFGGANWAKFLVPLIIAGIIGFGYGYLVNYIRDVFPTIVPDTIPTPSTSPPPTTGTGTDPPPTTNYTIPPPSTPIPTTGNGVGIPTNYISIVLLIISGVIVSVGLIFVGIDFFKKRSEEFHEQILGQEKRWLPTATSSDHRSRVIRAYHKTSYDLIDHGVKSEKSMTPGEFKTSANDKFELPTGSFDGLTHLYEEARYSEHEIKSKESDIAEKYSEIISKKLKKNIQEEQKYDLENDSDIKDDNYQDKNSQDDLNE